jgi:hypothetical protein
MKTNCIHTPARFGGLIIALALFGFFSTALLAAEIPTGKGGATKLFEVGGQTVKPKTERSDVHPMSCSKCKDEYVRHVDYTARGVNKPTVVIVRHLCDGCGNEWVTAGHGKAKTTTAVHVCSGCGAEGAACCSSDKGVATTKEKEKKFEIAPIK